MLLTSHAVTGTAWRTCCIAQSTNSKTGRTLEAARFVYEEGKWNDYRSFFRDSSRTKRINAMADLGR